MALQPSRLPLVEMLIDKGAKVNTRNNSEKTPLIIAIEEQSIPIVEFLLSKNVNPTLHTEDQNTPLMIAEKKGNKILIRLLLDYGAPVDFKSNNNITALQMSYKCDPVEATTMLLAAGANIFNWSDSSNFLNEVIVLARLAINYCPTFNEI